MFNPPSSPPLPSMLQVFAGARIVVSRLDKMKLELSNYITQYSQRHWTSYMVASIAGTYHVIRKNSKFRSIPAGTNALKNPSTITTFNMRLYSDYWAAFGRQTQKRNRR